MPGVDDIVRAATVKTSSGEHKRPASRLCVLSIKERQICDESCSKA